MVRHHDGFLVLIPSTAHVAHHPVAPENMLATPRMGNMIDATFDKFNTDGLAASARPMTM
jgi:hypothetical protein